MLANAQLIAFSFYSQKIKVVYYNPNIWDLPVQISFIYDPLTQISRIITHDLYEYGNC